MPSFDVVNYSLRPNKAIQRSLVFEGVRILQNHLNLENQIFIGLGSLWFVDFQIAHKFLGIKEMISIEASEVGYRRARFNQPFKSVEVLRGYSYDVIPTLFLKRKLSGRPWFLWLDYDDELDSDKMDEIRSVIEHAPPDTVFVVTFPADAKDYGIPRSRRRYIQRLLGSVVPDDLRLNDCNEDNLPITLMNLVADYMQSVAASVARPGGFTTAFKLSYSDKTPMVTVGGILPSRAAKGAADTAVRLSVWPGIPEKPILTPPLTLREVATLQSQLPTQGNLTRRQVRRLGFDLEVDQLRSFQRYYRYYPIFAQITT